jgi:hypothetical protein
MSKTKTNHKKAYIKPKLVQKGSAKQLIKAEFSELFDQKNSAVSTDMFNATVS